MHPYCCRMHCREQAEQYFIAYNPYHLKTFLWGICRQRRPRSDCTSVQSDQALHCLLTELILVLKRSWKNEFAGRLPTLLFLYAQKIYFHMMWVINNSCRTGLTSIQSEQFDSTGRAADKRVMWIFTIFDLNIWTPHLLTISPLKLNKSTLLSKGV